jgi:hypothetical protein
MKIEYERAYFVSSSSRESTINPLAIRPQLSKMESGWKIEWPDTSGRGKSFQVSELVMDSQIFKNEVPSDPPKEIKLTIVKDEQEEIITLQDLTFDIFTRSVLNRVEKSAELKNQLKTDLDVQNYYLENF